MFVILSCAPDSDHAKFPKAPLIAAARITNLIKVIFTLTGPVTYLYLPELEQVLQWDNNCATLVCP